MQVNGARRNISRVRLISEPGTSAVKKKKEKKINECSLHEMDQIKRFVFATNYSDLLQHLGCVPWKIKGDPDVSSSYYFLINSLKMEARDALKAPIIRQTY